MGMIFISVNMTGSQEESYKSRKREFLIWQEKKKKIHAENSEGKEEVRFWKGLEIKPNGLFFSFALFSCFWVGGEVQHKGFHHLNVLIMEIVLIIFSSVIQSCLTLCDHMECRMAGFTDHHQLLELAQTHVYWVSDGIQLSHPLLSSSPSVCNLSQHQGLFQWVSSSHKVAKVL